MNHGGTALRWPLRFQLFLPFSFLLAVAIATTATTAAYFASQQATRQRIGQSQRIIDTLSSTRLPYSSNVLQQMRGLSGGHFVVVNEEAQVQATTLDFEGIPESWDVWQQPLNLEPTPAVIRVGEADYRWRVLEPPSDRPPIRVVVLVSQESLRLIQWQAAWPPLAIGAVTLFVMLLVSGWLAVFQSRRINRVRGALASLAQGEHVNLSLASPDDEIRDLIRSTNKLSQQLGEMQIEIRRTEGLRVLGQLASGFAHQLRNAVAGAKLAIQLHVRRHGDEEKTSLETALNQLDLTNRQIQSLLSLSRSEPQDPMWTDFAGLVEETLLLVRPHVEHWRIEWVESLVWESGCLVDRQPMQAALMNLLINAIEAAGEQGGVSVRGEMDGDRWKLEIEDDGPGVPDNFEAKMYEPFTTTKPEGVGIGLAMAKRAVEQHGGTLQYRRDPQYTCFTLVLERQSEAAAYGD